MRGRGGGRGGAECGIEVRVSRSVKGYLFLNYCCCVGLFMGGRRFFLMNLPEVLFFVGNSTTINHYIIYMFMLP